MVNLEIEDRNKLIEVLTDIPELGRERDRRLMLELAGLEKLVSKIDISGTPFFAIGEIVSYLSKHGRLTYEREALGQFLNAIKEVTGIEQKEYFNKLLSKYNMMTPIATSSKISQWRSQKTSVSNLERTIGENTLRHIDFLAEGLKVARSVSYIEVDTGGHKSSATGFAVGRNLVLTAHHVLPQAQQVKSALFRFNYEESFLGKAKPVFEYKSKQGGIFYTNKYLDFTLVELEGSPGKEWGYLPLAAKEVLVDTRVNIIQHPLGQPKQISMQNNFVQYVGGNVIQYVTSTLPGSSGSPVFNDNWEVVALHHAGGKIPEPTTGKSYYRKEGIYIGSILADLPEELRQLLTN